LQNYSVLFNSFQIEFDTKDLGTICKQRLARNLGDEIKDHETNCALGHVIQLVVIIAKVLNFNINSPDHVHFYQDRGKKDEIELRPRGI